MSNSDKQQKTATYVYSFAEILVLCTPAMHNPGEAYTAAQLHADLADSGMRVAKRLLPKMEADLHSRGIFDAKQLSKSFRTALVDHLGRTKNGASTYWYNLQGERKGRPLYSTNQQWNQKKRNEKKANQANTEQPVDSTEPVLVESSNDIPEVVTELNSDIPVTSEHTSDEQTTRWAVQDVDTLQLVVKNLTSRDAAQQHNRELKEQGQNTKVWDKTKDAA